MVLGMEPRPLDMAGKRSTTEQQSQLSLLSEKEPCSFDCALNDVAGPVPASPLAVCPVLNALSRAFNLCVWVLTSQMGTIFTPLHGIDVM